MVETIQDEDLRAVIERIQKLQAVLTAGGLKSVIKAEVCIRFDVVVEDSKSARRKLPLPSVSLPKDPKD